MIQVKRNSRRLADLTIELDNKNEELRARLNDFEEKNQQLQSEVDVLQDFCHSRMESVAAEEENSWKVEKKSLVERIHQLDEDLAVERRKVQQLNGSQSSEIQSLRIKYDKLLKEHQECERRVVVKL